VWNGLLAVPAHNAEELQMVQWCGNLSLSGYLLTPQSHGAAISVEVAESCRQALWTTFTVMGGECGDHLGKSPGHWATSIAGIFRDMAWGRVVESRNGTKVSPARHPAILGC